jgi:hypothetical protein
MVSAPAFVEVPAFDLSITVVNRHLHTEDEHTLYIGRGTPLGNPFKDGTRHQNIIAFRRELEKALHDEPNQLAPGAKAAFEHLVNLSRIRPVKLQCSCAPKPCHGDVIRAFLLRELGQDEDAGTPKLRTVRQPGQPEPFCVIEAPDRGRSVYDDEAMAMSAIRRAVDKGGYTLIGIAGGREIDDGPAWVNLNQSLDALLEFLDWPKVAIVSGGAKGVDKMAADLAWLRGYPLVVFPARWNAEGQKVAGPTRNARIAKVIHELVAMPGEGPGTRDMMTKARLAGIPVMEIRRHYKEQESQQHERLRGQAPPQSEATTDGAKGGEEGEETDG